MPMLSPTSGRFGSLRDVSSWLLVCNVCNSRISNIQQIVFRTRTLAIGFNAFQTHLAQLGYFEAIVLSMGHGFPAAVLFINSKHRHALQHSTNAYKCIISRIRVQKFISSSWDVLPLLSQWVVQDLVHRFAWRFPGKVGMMLALGGSGKMLYRSIQLIDISSVSGWMENFGVPKSRICPTMGHGKKKGTRVLRCCAPPGGFRHYLRRHSQRQEWQKNFPDALEPVRDHDKLRDQIISFLQILSMADTWSSIFEAKLPRSLVPALWFPGWSYDDTLGWCPIFVRFFHQVPSWGGHSRSQWHWFLVHGHGLSNTFMVGMFETWKGKATKQYHTSTILTSIRELETEYRCFPFRLVKLTGLVCAVDTNILEELAKFSNFIIS